MELTHIFFFGNLSGNTSGKPVVIAVAISVVIPKIFW